MLATSTCTFPRIPSRRHAKFTLWPNCRLTLSTMSAPPASSPGLTDNPDFLSVLAHGLHDSNGPEDRNFHLHTPTPHGEADHRLLNSLSCSLVSSPRGQVVAVGALKGRHKPQLCVAENTKPSEKTVAHLKALMRQLQKIHALWKTADSPSLPTSPHSNTLRHNTTMLHHMVIAHGWPKLAQRFIKNFRHTHFLGTVNDICGMPALKRGDLANDRERELLESLQALAPQLRAIDGRVLQELAAAATPTGPSNEVARLSNNDVSHIYSFLVDAKSWKKAIETGGKRADWQEYTHCTLLDIYRTSGPDLSSPYSSPRTQDSSPPQT